MIAIIITTIIVFLIITILCKRHRRDNGGKLNSGTGKMSDVLRTGNSHTQRQAMKAYLKRNPRIMERIQ